MFVYIQFSSTTTKKLLSYFYTNNGNTELLIGYTMMKSKQNTAHVTLDFVNITDHCAIKSHYKNLDEIVVTIIGHVVNNNAFAFVVTISDDIFNAKYNISNKDYLHVTMVLNNAKPVYCRYMMEKYMGIEPKKSISDVSFVKYDQSFNIDGKLFFV